MRQLIIEFHSQLVIYLWVGCQPDQPTRSDRIWREWDSIINCLTNCTFTYGYCVNHIWCANSPIALFSWNKLLFLWLARSSVSPPPQHLHVQFGSMQSVGSVGLWDLLSSELLVVRATETQPYGPITRQDESCKALQEQGVDSHWDQCC